MRFKDASAISNGLRFVIDWTDIRRPSVRDLRLIGGALVAYGLAVAGLNLAAEVVLPSGQPPQHLAAETAPSTMSATQVAWMLFALWVVSALEEYTFRNLLQKLLYTWFHHRWAIIMTSVVFAALHVPAYGGLAQFTAGAMLPLLTVFAGSVILGYAYWQSSNLVVPIVVHGLINTVALAVILR